MSRCLPRYQPSPNSSSRSISSTRSPLVRLNSSELRATKSSAMGACQQTAPCSAIQMPNWHRANSVRQQSTGHMRRRRCKLQTAKRATNKQARLVAWRLTDDEQDIACVRPDVPRCSHRRAGDRRLLAVRVGFETETEENQARSQPIKRGSFRLVRCAARAKVEAGEFSVLIRQAASRQWLTVRC